jgi:hypothetical protein
MLKKRKYVKSGKFSKKNLALDAPIPFSTNRRSSSSAVVTGDSEENNQRQDLGEKWSCKM